MKTPCDLHIKDGVEVWRKAKVQPIHIPRADFNRIQAELKAMKCPCRDASALAGLRLLSGHFVLKPVKWVTKS